MERSILLCEFIGVSTIRVNVTNGSRSPTLAEKMHEGVDSFWIVVMEVPKHSSIITICGRVAFVRSIERRKLDRISDEKYGLDLLVSIWTYEL